MAGSRPELSDSMFNALKNPTTADKRALALFFAISLICAVYFASGVFVSYVSPPEEPIEMSKNDAGFVVRVENLGNFDTALRLSNEMRNQRSLQALIETGVRDKGYTVKIGPLATQEMAERMVESLQGSGYDRTRIVESCPPENQCPPTPSASGSVEK